MRDHGPLPSRRHRRSSWLAAFSVAFDPAGRTAEAYKVAVMPTSFLINRDGSILLRHAGFDTRHTAELEKRIDEELAR